MKNACQVISVFVLIFVFSNMHAGENFDPIQVDGNRFIDADSQTVVFKGLAFSDPDKLVRDGQWGEAHFKEAAEWGADIVRLPVHPRAWRQRGQEAYLELLDQGIDWSKKFGLYVMIDWHSIGNLWNQIFQDPMYETTIEETQHFWRIIARRYRHENAVAFYEIFNEPTVSGEQFGDMNWAQWSELVKGITQIIRAYDEQTIVLVAGFDWAYDLTPVREHPIKMKNIAYVSHPYPQKREAPWEKKWEKDWGFVADTHPVFVTEFGFQKDSHVPVIGTVKYGKAIIDYMKKKGISWTPWCFDPDWEPVLIKNWNYEPSTQGEFFKQVLQVE